MLSFLRRSSLVLLTAVLASALTAACQTNPPAAPPAVASSAGMSTLSPAPPPPRGCAVTIMIELRGKEPIAVPDVQIVRRSQSVEWLTDVPNASVEIFFKGENPLEGPPACARQQCVGSPPRPGTSGKRFNYGIRVTTPDGTYESDPVLIIRE